MDCSILHYPLLHEGVSLVPSQLPQSRTQWLDLFFEAGFALNLRATVL